MNKTFVIIAATALLVASGLYNVQNNSAEDVPQHIKAIFHQWQLKHGKVYNSPNENNYRLKVFFKNYLAMKAESLTAVTYTVGLNKFSDLTKEEFKTKYTGLIFNKEKRQVINLEQGPTPPASVNWVTAGAVGPSKTKDNAVHAGLSPSSLPSKVPTKSLETHTPVSPNNNWLTALAPMDHKVATEDGWTMLSDMSRTRVLREKLTTHTPPTNKPVNMMPPRSSLRSAASTVLRLTTTTPCCKVPLRVLSLLLSMLMES